jgi:hypothetical protein
MTPADCINRCLTIIREKFYHDKPERIFFRDRTALTKAIARYGYACSQRGWEFDSVFVTRAVMATLVRIDDTDIQYLPVYLEQAIDRSVGQRAEELNAQDKRNKRNREMTKALQRIQSSIIPDNQPVFEKSDTEILAQLYRQLNTRKPKKVAEKQLALI